LSGNVSTNKYAKNSHTSRVPVGNMWKVDGEMLSTKETEKIVDRKLAANGIKDTKEWSLDKKYQKAKSLKLI